MAKKKRKFPANFFQLPLRLQSQIVRYGDTWENLSEGEKWYQRHKVRSRGRPVNAYIPLPDAPPCYGNFEDDTCGVCGQRYDQFKAGINYDDGIQLMLQAARREGVEGGGYRSRGSVLYAMAVLKRSQFYQRHELFCCRVVFEFQEEARDQMAFFPIPPIVMYLSNYGVQDGMAQKNIDLAIEIREAIMAEIYENSATQLSDFAYLRNDIRNLEKRYQRRDWWRQSTRDTDGTGEFIPLPIDTDPETFEFFFPSDVEADIDEDEFPF